MALTDQQASDLLEDMARNTPHHLLRAALTVAREWRANMIFYRDQTRALHKETAKLYRLLKEMESANTNRNLAERQELSD